MRLARAVAPAADARRFYHDLRAAGASPRQSPGWTLWILVAVPLGLLLVALGFSVEDQGTANVLWGIGAALAGSPLLWWLSPSTWLLLLAARRLDSHGWEREGKPWEPRPNRPLPYLRVAYRVAPLPVVAIGIGIGGRRTLALRNLTLRPDADELIVLDGERVVARLGLTTD